MDNYSVLMSVYKSEKPLYLKMAIESMLNQELKPSDFVIICDGALTNELDSLLSRYQKDYPDLFNVVKLEENVGLGKALSIAIQHCKYEYVLRMDSDDLSLPERSKLEIEALEEGFDIVGGYVEEFANDDLNNITSVRKVPLTQEEIYAFTKKRCPFNHPTVAYRKSFILSAGNYSELRKCQDWELWVRCVQNNAKVKNFDKVFVQMRYTFSAKGRRTGKVYLKCINYILKEMKDTKFISSFDYHKLKLYYSLYSVTPKGIKTFFTKHFLRSKKQ